MMMRSKLFIPAVRPDLFAKAEASAADALSFDLEDSVPEERKDEARDILSRYLRDRQRAEAAPGKAIVVRVNAFTSAHFAKDLEALLPHAPDIINLPMAEDPDQVFKLGEMISPRAADADIGILVNIETPVGLRRAADLAKSHPKVAGLQIGYADLLEPCGMDRNDPHILSHVRIAVRFAAAEAGIAAYDAAFAAVKDQAGFREECMTARRQGFAGKSCIHPSQIAIANESFAPSDRDVAWAGKVLEAAVAAEHKGLGAFLVGGQMIDKPFLARARAIIAAAETKG